MFSIRGLVFAMFIGFLFCGLECANGECNGITTYLNSSQNGSLYAYMDGLDFVNRSCTWLITAPIGQRVLIYFTSFSLSYCYRCDCGSVTISDGSNMWSTRLAKYCGSDLPRPVYSSGTQILVSFEPSFTTYEYFTLHYSTLFHHSSECPSIDPGASAGVIYSPNFPWNYADDSSCEWHLIKGDYQQHININFTYLNLYECGRFVEIYNEYSELLTKVSLCETPVQSSFTYSESVKVYYSNYGYSSSSSFLAFYQIGRNVPFPVTTYRPPTTSQLYTGCQPYSEKIIFVQSSGSKSISSSVGRGHQHTLEPGAICTWNIATTEGHILELKFGKMTISGYDDCSWGNVTVRDGTGSSARSLGTFCEENVPSDVVSSTGNHMFIRFYAQNPFDYFKASINSKETEAHRLRIPGIVVPTVLAVVLFAVFVILIKCIKIRRLTGGEHSSQFPTLLESESSPDDEEMIDLAEDNNTASGTYETV